MDEQLFLDFKLNFNLCTPRRNKPSIVYAVVYFKGKQCKINTGVKVHPRQWNKRRQVAVISNGFTKLDNHNNSIVNSKLQEVLCRFEQSKLYLCDNVEQIYNLYRVLKQYINPSMKDKNPKVKNKELASIVLLRYVENKYKGNQARGYQGAINIFKSFLLEKGLDDSWSNINKKVLDEYQDYLCTTKTKGAKVRAYNTINGCLTKLRTLLKKAHEDENIPFDYYQSEVDKFVLIKCELSRREKKSKQVPLTEEQVKSLYELKLSGKEEEVRDVFVCQCLLGQRISDMPKLFKGDYTIIDDNAVTITVQKTGENATIYLFPIAKLLLEKYRRNGFKYLSMMLNDAENKENRMADVLNITIKEICKKAGFNSNVTYTEQRGKEKIVLTKKMYELIHTHIARHTFITIMCNMGIPKETVIIATAHEDTKMIDEVYLHQTVQHSAKLLSSAIEAKAKGSIFNIGDNAVTVDEKRTVETTTKQNTSAQDVTLFASALNAAQQVYENEIESIREQKLENTINMVASLMEDDIDTHSIAKAVEKADFNVSIDDGSTGNVVLRKNTKKKKMRFEKTD